MEHLRRGSGAGHQGSLRDLEVQPSRVDPGATHDLSDLVGETRVGELAPGQVHVDLHRLAVAPGLPGLGGPARLLDHPTTEGSEHTALLGHREEVVRAEQAALGVVPPQQRLGAKDPAIGHVHDGLVVQGELVALETAAQRRLGGEARHRGMVQRVVEHLGPVAPSGLRLVHRRVRVAQQVARVLVADAHHDADAHRNVDLLVADVDAPAHTPLEPLGELDRTRPIGDALTEDHELVAAEAGHEVAGAYEVAKPSGDGDEHLVADVVAEAVVDDLEPVEVDEEQRQGGVRLAGSGDGQLELVEQQHPVGQRGQRVVEGEVGKLVLVLLDLGDVVERADVPGDDPGSVAHRLRADLDPAQRPIGPDDAHPGVEAVRPGAIGPLGTHALGVVGVQHPPEIVGGRQRSAGDVGPALVRVAHPTDGVELEDRAG